jgi:arylsulfatase A-like enzyme
MEQLNKHYGVDTYPEVNTDLVVRENADVNVAQYARHYFANVTSVDMYLGHVLQQLENMGELENTIVIFSSDHGEMMGSHGKTGKNTFETESLAIPLIVHWPKGLSPGISHTLFSVPDVLPTVMGLAGLENYIPDDVEGINQSNIILSESKKPKAALLMLSNARGVLTEKYTLCLKENGRGENKRITEAYIYDNVNDPYQLNKIGIAEVPTTSQKLLKHLANLLEQTNDPWYQTKKYSSVIPYN